MSKREEKPCLLCGKMFGRSISGVGNVESSSHFAKRLFCSRICGAIGRRKPEVSADEALA
jgi:hypothetical protein